jgi:glutamate dehydrogenase/leucine dehydrogenase
MGFRVLAVSDSKGGIFDKKGLDPKLEFKHKKETGTVAGFPHEEITNEELLEMDVDILVPAALENVITKDNASNIKAKIVAELANGPVTPGADKILFENGVFQCPDILANAGGVTVSYFEWVQNRMRYYWTEEEIFEKLDKIMTKSFNNILQLSLDKNVNMRTAAFIHSVHKVADAMKIRGYW